MSTATTLVEDATILVKDAVFFSNLHCEHPFGLAFDYLFAGDFCFALEVCEGISGRAVLLDAQLAAAWLHCEIECLSSKHRE